MIGQKYFNEVVENPKCYDQNTNAVSLIYMRLSQVWIGLNAPKFTLMCKITCLRWQANKIATKVNDKPSQEGQNSGKWSRKGCWKAMMIPQFLWWNRLPQTWWIRGECPPNAAKHLQTLSWALWDLNGSHGSPNGSRSCCCFINEG